MMHARRAQIYEGRTPGSSVSTMSATNRDPVYLVKGEKAVVDVPILNIDPTMRRVRHAIYAELDLPYAKFGSFGPGGLDHSFDRYDRSE